MIETESIESLNELRNKLLDQSEVIGEEAAELRRTIKAAGDEDALANVLMGQGGDAYHVDEMKAQLAEKKRLLRGYERAFDKIDLRIIALQQVAIQDKIMRLREPHGAVAARIVKLLIEVAKLNVEERRLRGLASDLERKPNGGFRPFVFMPGHISLDPQSPLVRLIREAVEAGHILADDPCLKGINWRKPS